jgi:hypothetical protein
MSAGDDLPLDCNRPVTVERWRADFHTGGLSRPLRDGLQAAGDSPEAGALGEHRLRSTRQRSFCRLLKAANGEIITGSDAYASRANAKKGESADPCRCCRTIGLSVVVRSRAYPRRRSKQVGGAMVAMTWSRARRLLAAGLAAAAVIASGAPIAAADSTTGDSVCRSSVDSGVEVDSCTGNPNPNNGPPPQVGVRVVPQFCLGIGFGSCDD